ncbi:MAG: hypothetical protein J6Q54_08305 [Oscillospiraceae bacterium]|nr:hypothetical protein [Oscillospiraceae bacterium]
MESMKKGLTGNQLKLIALITMTIDHIGYILLPQYRILRIIGRLAFPIYAYMIAEGCIYTKSMGKYLTTLAVTAVICQISTFLAGSLYLNIMVTFSLSVGIIRLLKKAKATGKLLWKLAFLLAVAGAYFLAEVMPVFLPGTDYGIDYGFLGIILPVGLYVCKNKQQKLCVLAVVLAMLSGLYWSVQWYSLLSIPLLALYNGSRGKWKLKWLFYAWYPAHLAVLWGIAIFL